MDLDFGGNVIQVLITIKEEESNSEHCNVSIAILDSNEDGTERELEFANSIVGPLMTALYEEEE